jgi:hypothetical protein
MRPRVRAKMIRAAVLRLRRPQEACPRPTSLVPSQDRIPPRTLMELLDPPPCTLHQAMEHQVSHMPTRLLALEAAHAHTLPRQTRSSRPPRPLPSAPSPGPDPQTLSPHLSTRMLALHPRVRSRDPLARRPIVRGQPRWCSTDLPA